MAFQSSHRPDVASVGRANLPLDPLDYLHQVAHKSATIGRCSRGRLGKSGCTARVAAVETKSYSGQLRVRGNDVYVRGYRRRSETAEQARREAVTGLNSGKAPSTIPPDEAE